MDQRRPGLYLLVRLNCCLAATSSTSKHETICSQWAMQLCVGVPLNVHKHALHRRHSFTLIVLVAARMMLWYDIQDLQMHAR